MFKKMLLNFAMIQTILLATSFMVGLQLPLEGSLIAASGFIYLASFGLTFIPSVLASFLFAYWN